MEQSYISSGRKYVLQDTCGLTIGCTKFPETLVHPEDDYSISNGVGYGIKIHFADIEEDLVVVMDEVQLKTLIKGMKAVRRVNKRGRRGKY
jgi:hypothetical protein